MHSIKQGGLGRSALNIYVGSNSFTIAVGRNLLAQVWANYSLGAMCGPFRFSILSAKLEDIILIVHSQLTLKHVYSTYPIRIFFSPMRYEKHSIHQLLL